MEAEKQLALDASQYDYVRFTWTDINGVQQGQTVPGRNAAKYLRSGIQCFSAAIGYGPLNQLPTLKEVTKRRQGNMAAMGVAGTLHAVPWVCEGEYQVGEVLCETKWLDDDTPQAACPRYVARKQLDRLDDMGYSILCGWEHEFKLEDPKTAEPVFEGPCEYNHYEVAKQSQILFSVDKYLSKIGINVDKIHTEYSAGQFEVILQPYQGIQAADNNFILKQAIKEVSQMHGLHANFMTVPSFEYCGSASHFNHSIWTKDSKSAFFDPSSKDKLSDVTRFWIGGLVKHASAITAICSPTVNCFRRLHGLWVPNLANWGIDDRVSTFRVKNYNESATLIENRLCSGVSNPYLVLAANIAAGIDGLVNQYEPGPQAKEDAPEIPFTLEEALVALEADLVIREALGEEFVNWFTQMKREIEITALKDSDPKEQDNTALQAEVKMYSKYM